VLRFSHEISEIRDLLAEGVRAGLGGSFAAAGV
jgi:hypothetical protein